MCKEYVVTFLNVDTNKINFDCFMDASEDAAKRSFRECYRHGRYQILSVVETGRY